MSIMKPNIKPVLGLRASTSNDNLNIALSCSPTICRISSTTKPQNMVSLDSII